MRALPVQQYQHVSSLDEAHLRQLLSMECLLAAYCAMHKYVEKRVSDARSKSIALHNKQTNTRDVQFSRGDFVVVRMAKRAKRKLGFMWQGPAMVAEVMIPSVFKVKTMTTGKASTVHARRLQFYRSPLDGASLTDQELAMVDHIAATFEKVEKFKSIKQEGDE